MNESIPNHNKQRTYVYKRLKFYLSSYDYVLIAKGFQIAWDNLSNEFVGDGDFKNLVYRFLEEAYETNPIPQEMVDRTIDLILEYLESIGQYGADFNQN